MNKSFREGLLCLFLTEKNIRIMKHTCFMLILFVFQSAASSYAQSTKINLNIKKSTLKQVFKEIESQTEFTFFYNDELIDLDRTVDIRAQRETIESILNKVLTDCTYEIQNQNILLIPNSRSSRSSSSQQQKGQITGAITDERGEPIIGANVIEKGTSNGVVTDLDGKFSLSVQKNMVLQISYIGYINQEVQIKDQTFLQIILQEDTQALDEVIVIGYGTMKKKDLSGSVASVKGDDLMIRKTTQLSTALQGATAGLMVTPSNGPGATADIKIRGVTTIGDSSPLVLVDGVPGDINMVNPNDVEDISVLKDAASASIYGSRAAAGVILITTKRAKDNDLNLSYTFEQGWEKPTKIPQYMNAQQYIELANELRYNDNNTGGWYQVYTEDEINNWMTYNKTDPDKYPNTDWNNWTLNSSAPRQSHIVSISGGTKKLQTKASFNYDKTDAIYDGRWYKRMMIRINNDLKINDYLSTSIDISFRNVTKKTPTFNPFGELKNRPVNPAMFSDGRYGTGAVLGNPYALMKEGGDYNEWYNRIGGKASIDFTPLQGLKISGVIAATHNYNKTKKFQKRVPYTYLEDPNTVMGYYPWGYEATELTEKRDDNYDYTVQFFANYIKTFGKHDISTLVGNENYYTFFEYMGASRDQYEFEKYPYLDLGPLAYRDNYGNASEYAYRSWFARVAYSYAHKYLLQFNFRRDGSSRFKPDHRWGSFPSVSVGWILSEENFLKNSNISWLSFLKLRGSWGKLGNERIGTYPTSGLIVFSNSLFYQNGTAISALTAAQTTYVIQSLTWEKTESYNIGLDAYFLDNRLRFTGDYYKKKTNDMLLSLEIPSYVGYDNPSQNAGKMHTKGWEVELGWDDNIGDLRYNISVNLSDFVSKMGDLGGTEFLGSQVKKEGSEFNEWYGYKTDGLFLTQEEVDNSAKINNNVKVGDIKYQDISGPDGIPDGKISPEYDRVLLGGSLPQYMYGTTINLGYHDFDFSVVFQGVGKQNTRYAANDYRWGNNFAQFMEGNYWSTLNTDEQNEKAFYPRISETNYTSNNETMSDYWLFNGRYLRLKNLTIGYSLPQVLTQKVSISRLRFYVSANNLFSIDKYPEGLDPESNSFGGYPTTKSVIIGASVNF